MKPLFPWFFSSLSPSPSRYHYTAQSVDLITAQKDYRESEKHMQSAQKKKKKKRKERGTLKKEKRKKEREKSQRLSVRYSIGSISGVNTKLRYIPVPVERIWYGKLRQSSALFNALAPYQYSCCDCKPD